MDGWDDLRDRKGSNHVSEVRVVKERRKEVERGAEDDGDRRDTQP